MALQFVDRVRVATATTGTGAITIGAALVPFTGFSALSVGDTAYYWIEDGNNWETGLGTLSSAGVWTRTTIYNTSAGNTSPISLSGSAILSLGMSAAIASLLNTAGATNATAISTETTRATAAEAAVQTIAYDNLGRNRIQNSLFNVQQRGAGAFTTNGAYTADRWTQSLSTSTLSTTLVSLADTDRTAIGDEEAQNALQGVFGGTSGTNDFCYIIQKIESVRRLSNKTVTLSFWARATSGTPKLGISYSQVFGAGGSPSATVNTNGVATAALSTTWTRYTQTATLPSASGKTLGTAGDYTSVNIWLSCGATNNTFAGGIGVQSGTIQLWGVQLEIGSAASAIEKLGFGLDLINCQRFYQTSTIYGQTYVTSGTAYGMSAWLPVAMRALPTIATLSAANANIGTVTLAAASTTVVTAAGTASSSGGTAINMSFSASADL